MSTFPFISVFIQVALLVFSFCHGSTAQAPCGIKEFRCSAGKCVTRQYICDGDNDCGDNSDEVGCQTKARGCSGVKCRTGQCIDVTQYCTGAQSCPNNDFEDLYAIYNCTCGPTQTRCNRDFRCIEDDMICDGKSDCVDGSDEDLTTCESIQCAGSSFRCLTNKRCITQDLVCNGRSDCGYGDTSDEDWAACHCNHTFHDKPCKCPPGYRVRFTVDGYKSCVDVDECTSNLSHLLCSHSCQNFIGGYRCTCREGYSLKEDNQSCALKSPLLLYEWQSVVMVADLNFLSLNLTNVHMDMSGYDIDAHSNTIYWTSATGGLIGSRSIHNGDSLGNSVGTNNNKILFEDIDSPALIAFDWISKNVFVVANTSSKTENSAVVIICNVEESGSSGCATLFELHEENITVTGIVVAPENGLIFWSHISNENGILIGSIWSAKMDGNDLSQLTNEMFETPMGLAIDYVFNRIFWIASTRAIESMDFDGSNRNVVIPMQETDRKLRGQVRGLAVFEDQILWFENDAMIRCTISSRPQLPTLNITSNCTSFVKPFLANAQYPKILHRVLQPKVGESPCDRSFVACRFICTGMGRVTASDRISNSTVNPSKYKCICPDKFKHDVGEYGENCVSPIPSINGSTETTPKIRTTAEAQTTIRTTTTTATATARSTTTVISKLVTTGKTTGTTTTELTTNNFTILSPTKSTLYSQTNGSHAFITTNVSHSNVEQLSCRCTSTAYTVVTSVILVTLFIFFIQAVVYFVTQRNRKFSVNSRDNLITSYIELQNDSPAT